MDKCCICVTSWLREEFAFGVGWFDVAELEDAEALSEGVCGVILEM